MQTNRMMKTRVLLAVMLSCSAPFSVLFSGCDTFETRNPKPPTGSNVFIWTPSADLDIFQKNLEGSIRTLDVVSYTKLFAAGADSAKYQFIPRPGLDAGTQSIFTNWNIESEHGYLSRLVEALPSGSRTTFTLSNLSKDINSDHATITAEYAILLPVESISGVTSPITGSFTMQLVNALTEQNVREWRITGWADFPPKSQSTSTWTDLKANLSR
jgi:hypothetical protein